MARAGWVALGAAVAAAALVGCAQATSAGAPGQDSSIIGQHDAPVEPGDSPRPIDARPLDAFVPPIDAPLPVTLTQTANNTLATSSLACGGAVGTNDYRTDENAWYRVFDLTALGITDTLHVTQVQFGVQEANGTNTVAIRIGTYSETVGVTLDAGGADWGAGGITAINMTTMAVAATTTGTLMTAPLTGDIPGGAKLIVEIHAPSDEGATNNYFFLASSTSAETTPGFLYAPSCGASVPSTPAELGQAVSPFVINVMAEH